METFNSFIIITLLLAANAFYVAAEFALVKARSFRIEALAEGGSSAARLTVRIQRNIEAYLAACQLGITMASLGLGWVGEPAVAALLQPMLTGMGLSEAAIHTTAFLSGFLIFSALHIVIGEQVPKTFAIRKPEPVAIWVAYPLHLSYLLAWPLNWLLNRATSAILSIFQVEEASHAEVLSSEEIPGLVTTSSEHGEIHHKQAAMLHNLFQFDQRQVVRIMMPISSVHSLDLAAPAEQNLATIRDTEHSRFPLIDSHNGNSLSGIILTKDIQRALLQGEIEPWRNLQAFSRAPLIIPESQGIATLFDIMRMSRAHIACVVDEYGLFIGIVTLEDLLEEIVGEIEDETDERQPSNAVIAIDANNWEADGLISLSDLESAIGLRIDTALDVNTLSGLFMLRLARMPAPGDTITESGYQLQLLTLQHNRVGKVHIQRTTASLSDQPPQEDH